MKLAERFRPTATPGLAVERNARLTVDAALVLLILFAIQIATVIIGVRTHLSLHVVIGLTLVPPLLIKISAVSWRFLQYYRHNEEYRLRGAPPPLLRLLGPVLVVVTLVLVGTGVAQFLAPNEFNGPRGAIYDAHVASFVIWVPFRMAVGRGLSGTCVASHGRQSQERPFARQLFSPVWQPA